MSRRQKKLHGDCAVLKVLRIEGIENEYQYKYNQFLKTITR